MSRWFRSLCINGMRWRARIYKIFSEKTSIESNKKFRYVLTSTIISFVLNLPHPPHSVFAVSLSRVFHYVVRFQLWSFWNATLETFLWSSKRKNFTRPLRHRTSCVGLLAKKSPLCWQWTEWFHGGETPVRFAASDSREFSSISLEWKKALVDVMLEAKARCASHFKLCRFLFVVPGVTRKPKRSSEVIKYWLTKLSISFFRPPAPLCVLRVPIWRLRNV